MDTLIILNGPSGAGKSTVREYIVENYDYTPVQSMTTRPKRGEDDIHHTFVTVDELLAHGEHLIGHDQFPGEDGTMHHYAATLKDFTPRTIYDIEENGTVELLKRLGGLYRIIMIYVTREDLTHVSERRKARDKARIKLPEKVYDLILYNDGTIPELYKTIDEFMKTLNEHQ